MDFLIKFINLIIKIIGSIFGGLISLLPNSPFNTINDLILDFDLIQYFNWLFPVNLMVTVLISWVACIAAFYAINAILKFLHLR